ncbi:helix-turn-helix domain-containing protein [Thermanaerosceptrum fracticalcis]|uniref:Helix-turn-helix domain-containing protein n=1 Tax=Thermanaerosceptrum fracticalcis TaxID=1712410 RepID=A0A7G6E444_THEFR|nr:helix-turn-helix transcriptional regulator [Thermanaerosceptrum fracticalcis]QNB46848.1 helix-turn-helix domain-containing protein [Thermanaerosceptrum fracticalcis]
MVAFGERIRELREEKGLSQEELGKILKVAKSTISQYELGKRNPDPETLDNLANILDCSVDYLLGRTDERRPAEKVIEEAISDDAELLEFFQDLKQRDDLQLLFKQVKPLSQNTIKRIIKYIKMVEDEESQE